MNPPSLRESQWNQRQGDVAIEKWNGTSYRPAIWDGWKTASDSQPITTPTGGRYSNHQVVLGAGTGEIDRTAGTATINWTGTFTVLFYSGASFFYVSDSTLTVSGGQGTVTAQVRGFEADRNDPTVRNPVDGGRVTLATLPSVQLAGNGFTVTPAYAGVRVAGTETPQATSGEHWGSFPQSFIDFLDDLGTAAFWFSSGSSTDASKVALPITVSFDASAPVVVPVPPTSGGGTVVPPTRNEIIAPPQRRSASATTTTAPAARSATPVGVAPNGAPVVSLAAFDPLPIAHDLRAVAYTDVTASAAQATSRLWWIGGALLLMAAALLAAPPRSPRSAATPSNSPLRRSGGTPQ